MFHLVGMFRDTKSNVNVPLVGLLRHLEQCECSFGTSVERHLEQCECSIGRSVERQQEQCECSIAKRDCPAYH